MVENLDLKEEIQKIKVAYENCKAIQYADDNIFNYIRCINLPKTPVCKMEDGGEVCRSRLMDCTKFRLVLDGDPVAVARMRMAIDIANKTGDQVPKTVID